MLERSERMRLLELATEIVTVMGGDVVATARELEAYVLGQPLPMVEEAPMVSRTTN